MWPITMDKKYGNINIYEIYFHILKKETFDFGMLNVTVYLFGCLFGYSLSQINIFLMNVKVSSKNS